jgi:hypothetical protein
MSILMIFEEKITSSKTSFQMASIYWQWMHILGWSNAHQHGKSMIMEMEELWIYWRWTPYYGLEVCTPIFLGEASN